MTLVSPSDAHLGGAEIAIRLAAVLALVLANAFFVAAEFGLVAVRRSRVEQLAKEGDSGARRVRDALRDLDRYISATQLGITLASLALGWVGEATIAGLVDRVLASLGIANDPALSAAAHSVTAVTIAFAFITLLHVVLGELAPKSIALVHPESVSRAVVLPLVWFSRLMQPAIWVLNGLSAFLLRLVGMRPASEASHAHSPEELRLLVMQASKHGTIDETDSAMLAGVFDFHQKRARDVMRPRTEIIAIPIASTLDEVLAIVRSEGYSRYPVSGESLDDIVGVFIVKDLILRDEAKPFRLADHVRDTMFVPDGRSAEKVLEDMRRTRAQMAIVLDEYAGTAGILTAEDLIEEVMGDIADEYDKLARHAILTDGVLELDGTMSIIDARSSHSLSIPEGDWSTVGGYVFGRLGRLPRVGDRVPFPGGTLEVVAMDSRRVAAVRVHAAPRKTEGSLATPPRQHS